MLYLIIVDGEVARLVDSATELDRLPAPVAQRMCKELKVPWRGLDGRTVVVQAIRPMDVRAWDVDHARAGQRTARRHRH